jgi:hypothetical protein
MADVVDLDARRPHLVICDADSPKVHVIPVAAARAWAEGTEPMPPPAILRTIVSEWLACVQAGSVASALFDS